MKNIPNTCFRQFSTFMSSAKTLLNKIEVKVCQIAKSIFKFFRSINRRSFSNLFTIVFKKQLSDLKNRICKFAHKVFVPRPKPKFTDVQPIFIQKPTPNLERSINIFQDLENLLNEATDTTNTRYQETVDLLKKIKEEYLEKKRKGNDPETPPNDFTELKINFIWLGLSTKSRDLINELEPGFLPAKLNF